MIVVLSEEARSSIHYLIIGEFVSYDFRGEGVFISSPVGGVEVEWDIVREVWVSRALLMLFVSWQQYLTFPVGLMTEEAIAFTESKVTKVVRWDR